jgi:hypothetical protein
VVRAPAQTFGTSWSPSGQTACGQEIARLVKKLANGLLSDFQT